MEVLGLSLSAFFVAGTVTHGIMGLFALNDW